MHRDPMPDTDELLVMAGRGDASARSALLDRHRDRLRRMVSVRFDRRLLARMDPSDIVQEALAEAAQKLSDYLERRPVPFYPWLRRIAWEQLVKVNERHVKAQRRSVAREACAISALPGESAALLANQLAQTKILPDHRLLQAELKSRVLGALGRLSESDRELLVLRYLEGLSNNEIAAIMDCSEGAIRTRHTRALARLSQVIDKDHQE